MPNFAITGVGGYIAPRHLAAIKDTGNQLLAACDPNQSVGVLDRYFFDARYFPEFERFDRHVEKLRRRSEPERVHYVSICSPNYLHDAHVRFALRVGAHAICEKPLVINPWNLDALTELEAESKHRIYTVLQLRVHPALVALRERLVAARANGTAPKKHDVVLSYVTSRGPWYLATWKGDPAKSGGVVTSIGIHFFDLLSWLFGDVVGSVVNLSEPQRGAGMLELTHARVRWFLSIDRNDLPKATGESKTTFRSIAIDGQEVEFSEGFTDLHTAVYRDILQGGGFGITDARPSIELTYKIRNAPAVGWSAGCHDLVPRPSGP